MITRKRKIEAIKITFTLYLFLMESFNIALTVEGMKDLNMTDVVIAKTTKKEPT